MRREGKTKAYPNHIETNRVMTENASKVDAKLNGLKVGEAIWLSIDGWPSLMILEMLLPAYKCKTVGTPQQHKQPNGTTTMRVKVVKDASNQAATMPNNTRV